MKKIEFKKMTDIFDLCKELYAQWGYTKSAANLMPNSWVLVKERDVAALQMICDNVGKAYAA